MYIEYKQLLSKVHPNPREAQIIVMEKYFGEPVDFRRKNYVNPFRVDKHGGCRFSFANNSLLFIDNANYSNSLTCFGVVQKQYNLTFHQALVKIAKDFGFSEFDFRRPGFENDKIVGSGKLFSDYNLNDENQFTPVIENSKKENSFDLDSYLERRKELMVQARNWNKSDRTYWHGKYKISLNTLKLFNVVPLETAHISDGYSKPKQFFSHNRIKELGYAYTVGFMSNKKDVEKQELVVGLKLYFPFRKSGKEMKWITNLCNKHVFGYEQLPATGENLIITSALKDVMCLYEIGINAVAFQSESIIPDPEIMEDLKSRFKNVYFLYDLDLTGMINSIKFAEMYKCRVLFLEKIKASYSKLKDVSDYVEYYESLEHVYKFLSRKLIKHDYKFNTGERRNQW